MNPRLTQYPWRLKRFLDILQLAYSHLEPASRRKVTMDTISERIIRLAGNVKTPLVLSGLVAVILYLIYRQILSMNIFDNIGGQSTSSIVQNIIEKMFILAIVSLLLGVASYILTLLLSRKIVSKSSKVELIDASLDPGDSQYEQVIDDGKKKIQIKKDLGRNRDD